MKNDTDNIIEFKRPEPDHEGATPNHPPLINLPPMTKYLIIVFGLIHAFLYLALNIETRYEIFLTYGFVPYLWSDANMFGMPVQAYISPLTYMGLHGNWLHLIMNLTMLMAFGAGVEKWYGAKRYLAFFILCGLLAIIPEFIIQPYLQAPLIGASGGLSGLFAAILLILQRQGRLPTNRYGIWPLAAVWIGISIVFGLFGTEMAGAPIAWIAHLGGFFAGFALTKLSYFRI